MEFCLSTGRPGLFYALALFVIILVIIMVLAAVFMRDEEGLTNIPLLLVFGALIVLALMIMAALPPSVGVRGKFSLGETLKDLGKDKVPAILETFLSR